MHTLNKKIMISLMAVAFTLIGSTKAQMTSDRNQLFDADWRFCLGANPEAASPTFDDSNWRALDLPHDWSIEGKIEQTNPMGGAGGYFPAGEGWYRKTFSVPFQWKGKCTTIAFDGVYMNAEVYINGQSLGLHPYGFTAFNLDLTPYLKYGAKNTLAVHVDNSKQINCRWYSGSGIYRHVWLIVTEPVHLKQWNTYMTTAEIGPESAIVGVRTVIQNETDQPQEIQVLMELAGNKKVIPLQLKANSEKEVLQTISVRKPSLWTPENPKLYTAKISVQQGKKTIDVESYNIGIRSLKYSAKKGFQLNGKSIKLNGGCVHHDNGCLGAAAYDRAEEHRVELLKAGGFNAVRTSHNPPSTAFLNACDRLGLMVIDESFDGWRTAKNPFDYSTVLNDWWQRDLESMVLRDRNHPSIIMWSIGNEIYERTDPSALETTKMFAGYIHQLDSTRPVTSAMTTWNQGWEVFDPMMAAHDVCGYNYQLYRAPADHIRVPSRIILQTESYPKEAFKNWDAVHKQDYVIGDVVWTALDYLGESAIGRNFYPGEQKGEHYEHDFFPWHGAYCGDIDLLGWRKPISHYRNLLWNDTEKLYLAVREPNPDNGVISETSWSVFPTWESWTWPGHEGKDIQVEVYSKYPSVRLYLNDKLIGEKQTGIAEEFKATFTLPYQPGILKTLGISNGREYESTFLKTAGQTTSIRLKADRSTLHANGQDLSYVTIELTDQQGLLQPNAENPLTFQVQGPGVIAGVDNANLKNTESYVAKTRKAWHGKALVVLKSTHQSGTILLTVHSAGLPDTQIRVKVKK
jgi:beta-galactosidase